MFSVRSSALVVAVAVAVTAAAPAAASAASTAAVFTHSATGGALKGKRLTLKGAGGRVTWAAATGRSGVIAVKRFHRGLFTRQTPTATGVLHLAGHRGGDEPTFRLSRPRYNPARRTVSYRIKPLTKKPLPSAAGIPRSRRFGAASLSIAGSVRDTSGDSCSTTIRNTTRYVLAGTSTMRQRSDTWSQPPHGAPIATAVAPGGTATWATQSDDFRSGCGNGATWELVVPPGDPNAGVTFALSTTITYAGSIGPDIWKNTCTPSRPGFTCELERDAAGIAVWTIRPQTPQTTP